MTGDRRGFWRGYDAAQRVEVVAYPLLALGVAGSIALARYALTLALLVIVAGLFFKLRSIKVRRAAPSRSGR